MSESGKTFDLDWSLPSGDRAGDATIRPEITADTATLPPLDLGEWSPLEDQGSDLVVRQALAAGGMGTVYLARQHSLDRVVAIKRATDGDARLASALVREARFMGRLNHPNIVPIYAVGRDADGAPAVVMKHIEGQTWRELEAPLDRQLEVLEAVCRAVQYAHDRGVLHRDLKPANVMVGAYGEVYLMDWGVAVDTGHAPSRIAGTPAYFAPEQLRPGEALSEATDVFQLGACLYEVLAGEPPFMARSVAESLVRAQGGLPELPEGVPEELAAVCRRAMAPEPGARFPSADALRERLAWCRRHAASMAVVRAATRCLGALSDPETAPEQAERLFTEARFGFLQALETSPDNQQAADGLVQVLGTMARLRAERGDVGGAAALVEELDERGAADPELRALVEARTAQLARSDALARDVDLQLFGRQRARAFAFLTSFGVAWLVLWLVLIRLGFPVTSYESAVVSMGFVCLVVWTGLWLGRSLILRTAANRSLGFTAGFICLALLLVRVVSRPLSLDLDAVFAMDLIVFGVASASASLALTPRLVPIGVIYAVGALAIGLWPGAALPIYTLFFAGGMVAIAVSYARLTPGEDASGS